MDRLLDLGVPGLIFVGLCLWLVRKVIKAARTEGDLEGERLQGALAEELSAARRFDLLEALASAVADRLLELPHVRRVRVRVRKPQVALPVEFSAVSLEREGRR